MYLFDPACDGEAARFFDVPISTNAAGNGHAKAPTIPPEAVVGLEGAHGVNWIVSDLVPEFEPSPTDELHLLLLLKDVRRTLQSPHR